MGEPAANVTILLEFMNLKPQHILKMTWIGALDKTKSARFISIQPTPVELDGQEHSAVTTWTGSSQYRAAFAFHTHLHVKPIKQR